MTRKSDGCSICDGKASDGRVRQSKRTREEWAEGAKTCFFCGLVDALLQDAKKQHGIDPSGGSRYEVSFGFRTDTGRYYLLGYGYTNPPDYYLSTVTEPGIRAEITFYNPMSKFGSFSLPSSHND